MTTPRVFRKRPVEVEAMQFDGTLYQIRDGRIVV